jgi:poly-gamma-glutamate biosynthesis protein PgsC/CapC
MSMGYEDSFLGLLLSLLFLGLTGLYPGGVIVPSYLVLFIDHPLRVAATFAVALLTLVSFRLASRYLIIFGTRRYVFMILTAGVWTTMWIALFPAFMPETQEFRVIGWIIPGLIANHFERQGILTTIAATLTVTVSTYFAGSLIGLWIR